MWKPNLENLSSQISEHFGLSFIVKSPTQKDGEFIIEVIPEGEAARLFRIRIEIGWRSLKAELVFGMFPVELIKSIDSEKIKNSVLFIDLANKFIADGSTVNFKINDLNLSPTESDSWPIEWTKIELALNKIPLAINTEDHTANDHNLFVWTTNFISLVLSIIPTEELNETEVLHQGLPEGDVIRVPVNKYERNRINRAMCIQLHGVNCQVCGINFEKIYGEDIGRDFIHIHHTTPVSKLGKGYIINLMKDLVPLCPNCHSMVHRKNPPLTVDELKIIFMEQKSKS